MTMPAITTLQTVLFDNSASIRYLNEHNVFYDKLTCIGCGGAMRRVGDRDIFRCYLKTCRKECSLRKHTFFFGSALNCSQVLLLGYLWLTNVKPKSAQLITGHSKPTVSSFYNHFRILVSSSLEEDHQLIGGEGIIVEIDETKMGKRKNNRGHRVEGVWIVGGVERTPERRVFLATVEKRDAETLTTLIERYVAPGSIVYTDLWRGYSSINELPDITHRTVNHSQHFKDPITGVHTNTVEGTWNGLKMHISPRNRVLSGMTEHLMEFIWRRRNEDSLWESFIDAIRNVHYDLD
jgi:transposase-like protein